MKYCAQMTGYVSTWRVKRILVEKCAKIDVHACLFGGAWQPGTSGTLLFPGNISFIRSVDYTVNLRENTTYLDLHYRINKEIIEQQVELVSKNNKISFLYKSCVQKIWGAYCPLCKKQKLWKLYLPPEGKYFGCIFCHNLGWQGKHN